MNKKIIWAIIIAAIVIIVWAVSNNRNETQDGSDKPIIIGAALSLSGPAVQDGESIKNGIELARADLEKEGIDVKILYQDDQTDGKNTVSAIHALATRGVQAIIGPTWSFLGDAGVPVADQLGLVAMMPANTSEYVNARSPYAFYTTIKVQELTPVLADWLKENNKKSIAIISNQGSWYATVEKAVKEAADQAEAKIVFTDFLVFGEEVKSLPTVLTKMKAANADILFTEIDSDEGVAVMFKKIRELGMKGDLMSVSTSLGRVRRSDPQQFSLSNNVYVLAPKTSEEFNAKYREAYGQLPSAYADTAYDSLMILVDAIQNKGSVPLNEYLKDATDYKGFANRYDFDENGDVSGGEWVINTIK